jgi:hypothetical protein
MPGPEKPKDETPKVDEPEEKPGRGKHPNSRKAIEAHQVKAGEVLNPAGVNRKRPYSDRHAEWVEKPLPEKMRQKFNKRCGGEVVLPIGATWGDAEVGRSHYEAAVFGNIRALKENADRIEGKPPQRLEITTPTKLVQTINVNWGPQPAPREPIDAPPAETAKESPAPSEAKPKGEE